MSKEEITCKIPNNQIHISKEKDEDCLIWISSKAINMSNTIDELQQQVKKQKEVIDKAVKYIDDLRDESAERQGFYNCFPDDLYIPDINELLDILNEVSE